MNVKCFSNLETEPVALFGLKRLMTQRAGKGSSRVIGNILQFPHVWQRNEADNPDRSGHHSRQRYA